VNWDLLVVTARTAQQRWLFERYLGQLWPASGAAGTPGWLVLQDPPGPQLGTAGATLHALCHAAQRLETRLGDARVLVLHCGGLSQRVPQLSHVGKAFAPGSRPPVETDADSTLFAEVVGELERLFQAMEPGAVVACGDIFYTAAGLETPCRRDEAVAVAYHASPEQSSRHGVYLWKPGGDRVSDSWQKPPAAQLRSLDAAQPWGLDTGILYLGAQVVEQMLEPFRAGPEPVRAFLARKGEWCGVELYRDLTPPMTHAWSPERRLAGAPGHAQAILSQFPLRVACPPRADLLHFGTNEELLQILSLGGLPRVYSSYIADGDFGPGAVLDRCLSEQPVAVGAGSYVSGLNRPGRELSIAPGRVAYQLPVRGGWGEAFVTLGVSDDAKRRPEDGATLLGETLDTWMRELGVSAEEVWEGVPEGERSLWNARLFPLGESRSVAETTPWLSGMGDAGFGARVDRWRGSERTSMAEANRRFDARRWWAHEQRIGARRFAAAVEQAVREGESAAVGELLRAPGVPDTARRLARQRLQALTQTQSVSLAAARACLVASQLSASPRLRERGFRTLSRVLVREHATTERELTWRLGPGKWLEACAPVRVDLAGGWTDTPPQACERGGTVLNAAFLLDGRRPLVARVERLAEPVVELVADDQNFRLTLAHNPLARDGRDARNPVGIHLAALQLVGLFGAAPLAKRLTALGGGLRLTTSASVPKGSGLGTSSILGAAVLAALASAFRLEQSLDDLCLGVLRLEQLMGTGGGWQDQVGGMWGGIKLAVSAPGIDQQPRVEPLSLSPEIEAEFEKRAVLFYTGEPRLAKDVLQRVVGGYLTGNGPTLSALSEMPGLARAAKAALESGDWEGLGSCVGRSWELNQQLEPTCTNENLDRLFAEIVPFVSGAKLAGAGGGGFLFALARDAEARDRLRERLAAAPAPAQLYDAVLDREGLRIVHG